MQFLVSASANAETPLNKLALVAIMALRERLVKKL